MIPPRLSLITLGVADLARARAPEEAQEASYLAVSARMASLRMVSIEETYG